MRALFGSLGLQDPSLGGKVMGEGDVVCESFPHGAGVPQAAPQAALLTPGSTDLGVKGTWYLQDETAAINM